RGNFGDRRIGALLISAQSDPYGLLVFCIVNASASIFLPDVHLEKGCGFAAISTQLILARLVHGRGNVVTIAAA
ncbi:MAG: hypothetical protein DMG26_07710, partial [Acidobacteria bacterium]